MFNMLSMRYMVIAEGEALTKTGWPTTLSFGTILFAPLFFIGTLIKFYLSSKQISTCINTNQTWML